MSSATQNPTSPAPTGGVAASSDPSAVVRPGPVTEFRRRVRDFLDPDSDWERPVSAQSLRRDVIGVFLAIPLAVLMVELARSSGAMQGAPLPVWGQYACVAAAMAPLTVRRRYPVPVMCFTTLLVVVVSAATPEINALWPITCSYLVGLYTAFAWARDRKLLLIGLAAVIVMMAATLAYSYAFSSAFEEYLRSSGNLKRSGLFSLTFANVLYGVLMNYFYIGAAASLGQVSWRSAWQRDLLAEQNTQLVQQADTLREQAQVEERLRIARELHDVVAHHVSVIGVQAAAARKVMGRDPDAATQALTVVETSSRNAVTEMRSLLGTLRGTNQGGQSREPDPSAADIPALVRQDIGIDVDFTLVEDIPGALAAVPPAVGLSLYRVVQESLANVRRHSTATTATVALRVARDRDGKRYAEAEILDSGRPRGGTSGSGLGLLGVRERLSSLGGVCEIGPRPTGGYRVRIRFPING